MSEKKQFKSINCGLQGQYIKDDGIVLTIDEVVELLNELHEENEHIKHTIKTMMKTERTELGRSVLKQLWEAIQ